ncbi:hypothetical protein CDL15_Pgr012755 [Punica granatum]|uniref:Uncharacterized protein n=1 Tax=Punica granatum TaxID=22663 RepID=A0A218XEA9_PUNGR|nr:hypothetical protein CDL15_Pgr012755 [Punica granatum]PKI48531.1 hypothetical protein CRG98_031081 [Punica granatum]
MPEIGSDRIGLARPKEKPPGRALDRTGDVGPEWAELPGWACKKNELGRGPLAKGGRDRAAAAATELRVAVLAPGRRDEGRNGHGRWLWASLGLRRGRPGPHRRLNSRNFRVFRRGFSEFSDLQIGQIESKISVFSCWVPFPPFRINFLSI